MTWHLVTPTCSRIMTWAPLRGCGSLPTFTSICDTLGDLFFFLIFFLNNFIYKTITYTTYSFNDTYIVLATYTTYTYTNYAYTTLRYMYYNTININLIYGWQSSFQLEDNHK